MLFFREIKKIACSIPYLLFVAAIAVGLSSQGVFQFGTDLMQEPRPGENYGVKYEEIPEIVMPAALEKLWGEFCENDYVAYPLGFIKHVKLNEKEQEEMAGILAEITGMGQEEILQKREGDSSEGITMKVGEGKESEGITMKAGEGEGKESEGITMKVGEGSSSEEMTMEVGENGEIKIEGAEGLQAEEPGELQGTGELPAEEPGELRGRGELPAEEPGELQGRGELPAEEPGELQGRGELPAEEPDELQGRGGLQAEGTEEMQAEGDVQELAVQDGLAYARFQELMRQADQLLGGGSSYAVESLAGYGAIPLTYEEARERYQLAVSSDQVTGGYARLFADYAGVMVMSFLPVFLAVILCMKDQRAKMEELIYTREASAARIVLARFLALLAAAMVPLVFLSYLSNMQVWGAYSGVQLDYLAPLTYSLGWIMPGVMVSVAAGMFLTELTGTPLAVALQGLWWFYDMNQGIRSPDAGYALLRLAPRHNVGPNAWFRTQEYLDHYQSLVQNRLLLAGASLLLAAATVYLYEAKRKGKIHGNVSFKKCKALRKESA